MKKGQEQPPKGPVLLVDDEKSNHAIFGAVLERAGYALIMTLEPRETAALIQKHRPRLVILDVEMPNMDGLQVLRTIRQVDDVPVIMMTGVDHAATAVKALQLGAFDYLTKPANFKRLLETMELALNTVAHDPDARMIGRYRIEGELGRGGMGIVYEATDLSLDRKVALKVLVPELGADPAFELRFLREARAAARIDHPAVVRVYDAGRYRGQLYVAMELIDGLSLRELLHEDHLFSQEEAVDIIRKAAAGLAAAHEAGMVHQDIKPANIMVMRDGTVKVLDFGLVRNLFSPNDPMIEEGFVGSPAYAAPQQIQSRQADARNDIYSLGLVLYELLVGEIPFDGKNTLDVLRKVLAGKLRVPVDRIEGLDPAIRKALKRMIAVKINDRPASMREVIGLFAGLGDPRPV